MNLCTAWRRCCHVYVVIADSLEKRHGGLFQSLTLIAVSPSSPISVGSQDFPSNSAA